jgi:hypothetical protein
MSDLTTATGKTFQSDYLVTHMPSHSIYLRIIGESKNDVVDVFDDPNETASITYNGETFIGFTTLKEVFDEGDAIKVRLSGGYL